MVKTGQLIASALPLRETRFFNPRLEKVGIEVIHLSQLRGRVDRDWLAQPERIEFHMLLLISAGRGRHTVDFEAHDLSPGVLIAVRPGQMQRWHLNDSLQGLLTVFEPSVLLPAGGRPGAADMRLLRLDEWPVSIECAAPVRGELGQEVSRLDHELQRFDQSDLAAALIRQISACLLLRVARAFAGHPAAAEGVRQPIHRLFVAELERSVAARPTVRELSRRLGYSVSTLNRACLAARGVPAKEFIDRRIALEAARLLVHTTMPVAQIGLRLGFTEATNFTKFFRRVQGHAPHAFRELHGSEALRI